MINPQWLEQPISRKNFHGPKAFQAIEVRLYWDRQAWVSGLDKMLQNIAPDQDLHCFPLIQ